MSNGWWLKCELSCWLKKQNGSRKYLKFMTKKTFLAVNCRLQVSTPYKFPSYTFMTCKQKIRSYISPPPDISPLQFCSKCIDSERNPIYYDVLKLNWKPVKRKTYFEQHFLSLISGSIRSCKLQVSFSTLILDCLYTYWCNQRIRKETKIYTSIYTRTAISLRGHGVASFQQCNLGKGKESACFGFWSGRKPVF